MGDNVGKKFRSDFLLPHKTILVGAGAAFNLFGDYFKYDYSSNGEEADRRAFMNDIGVINQDYMDVIDSKERELEEVE